MGNNKHHTKNWQNIIAVRKVMINLWMHIRLNKNSSLIHRLDLVIIEKVFSNKFNNEYVITWSRSNIKPYNLFPNQFHANKYKLEALHICVVRNFDYGQFVITWSFSHRKVHRRPFYQLHAKSKRSDKKHKYRYKALKNTWINVKSLE